MPILSALTTRLGSRLFSWVSGTRFRPLSPVAPVPGGPPLPSPVALRGGFVWRGVGEGVCEGGWARGWARGDLNPHILSDTGT